MLIQQKAIATPLLQLVQEDSSTSSTILKETQSRTTAKKQLCIQQTKKQVKFGTVEIHEHLNMLGAASIPNQGAPLTIDWERQAHHIFQVDDYESYKPPPRKGDEMIYPRSCRQNMWVS